MFIFKKMLSIVSGGLNQLKSMNYFAYLLCYIFYNLFVIFLEMSLHGDKYGWWGISFIIFSIIYVPIKLFMTSLFMFIASRGYSFNYKLIFLSHFIHPIVIFFGILFFIPNLSLEYIFFFIIAPLTFIEPFSFSEKLRNNRYIAKPKIDHYFIRIKMS